MCAICGIVGSYNQDENFSNMLIRKMTDVLQHRGPDEEGIICKEYFSFGHKRLAIIDLDTGQQPMVSEDGKITLVYNGEIYNYIELRQELSRKGIKFKTFSDTEVLLKLYETYGVDFLNKLNGMFAFVIYNERNNSFFAARDRFGIKPFYYTQLSNGQLLFASEIKALLIHPLLDIAPDYSSMSEYTCFQFCLGKKTLFRDVYKLEPGQCMEWDIFQQKKPTIKQYWTQSFKIDEYHTEEYFSDKLLLHLENSVNQQLRSDVTLGAYLSGGIDSSVISILAADKYKGGNFQSFTGNFSESIRYDETFFAKIVSEEIGSTMHIVTPSEGDFVKYLPKLIWYLDEPVAGPGVFPQFMVAKLASKHVKVVLGGQGGDELFGGYARYVIAYLEQCIKGEIFQNQEEGKHIISLKSMIPSLPLLKEYIPLLSSFWSSGLFEDMDQRYFALINRGRDMETILAEDILKVFQKHDVQEEFKKSFNQTDTTSYINKMLYFDQKNLLQALLQIEDRVSMAVSLESRVPFLDHNLVELANCMPPILKLKNGQTKWILKEAMKNLLPEEIINRRDKMGFPVPLQEWASRGITREFINDTLSSRKCSERGIFKPTEVQNLIKNEKFYGRQLWGVLCLELWFQIFIDDNDKNKLYI